MDERNLKPAEFKTLLHELERAGSPIDLAVAIESNSNQKVEIEQVGCIHDSMIFELEGGRCGVIADIAVTNQITRAIDVSEVELRTPWGDSYWDWLTPQRFSFPDRKKGGASYLVYRFPGKYGLQLPYEDVINHVLFERRRLPGKRSLEGWLLGVGGHMPLQLCHGQWLDCSLAIIASDHTEYRTPIWLWTERLEAIQQPRMIPFEEAVKNEKMAPRYVARNTVRRDVRKGHHLDRTGSLSTNRI